MGRGFYRVMAVPAVHTELARVDLVTERNWLLRSVPYVCVAGRTPVGKSEHCCSYYERRAGYDR